jgi:hypothetical protein
LQLARLKDQETLTNTIKQSTQQRGKEQQREREREPKPEPEKRFEEGELSRGELQGSPQGHGLTACWLMTTVERVIERPYQDGKLSAFCLASRQPRNRLHNRALSRHESSPWAPRVHAPFASPATQETL